MKFYLLYHIWSTQKWRQQQNQEEEKFMVTNLSQAIQMSTVLLFFLSASLLFNTMMIVKCPLLSQSLNTSWSLCPPSLSIRSLCLLFGKGDKNHGRQLIHSSVSPLVLSCSEESKPAWHGFPSSFHFLWPQGNYQKPVLDLLLELRCVLPPKGRLRRALENRVGWGLHGLKDDKETALCLLRGRTSVTKLFPESQYHSALCLNPKREVVEKLKKGISLLHFTGVSSITKRISEVHKEETGDRKRLGGRQVFSLTQGPGSWP